MTAVPHGRPARILLSNSITLNVGDAAIVEGMITTLRRVYGDDARFVVFDGQPAAAAKRYPHLSFLPWPWHAFVTAPGRTRVGRVRQRLQRGRAYAAAWLYGRGLRHVARPLLRKPQVALLEHYLAADVVASTGGTYLVEHYRLDPHAFDYRLCRLLRRPLVLYTQSLGPFRAERTRTQFTPVFRNSLVLLRDERSLRHLEELDAATADAHVCPDAAFALADPARLAAAASRGLPAERPLEVAVSVRDWQKFSGRTATEGMDAYRRAVAAMVTRLVREQGARVTFLSTCQGLPEYHTDDAKTAAAFVATLDPDVRERVEVDHAFRPPLELRDRLAGFDLAISTRMHFAILALCAGVPVLPIAYEFKTTELFARLELSRWVLDIDTIEAAAAAEHVTRCLGEVDAVRRRLFELVEREAEGADAAGPLVTEYAARDRRMRDRRDDARSVSAYRLPASPQLP